MRISSKEIQKRKQKLKQKRGGKKRFKIRRPVKEGQYPSKNSRKRKERKINKRNQDNFPELKNRQFHC